MSDLLTGDLFEPVLVEPARNLGADSLFVISGYASPAFATQHLFHLKNLAQKGIVPRIRIHIVYGMVGHEGLSKIHHELFTDLESSQFRCSYLDDSAGIHSKVYVWAQDKSPIRAFVGSANYTWNGFKGKQGEAVSACDPILAQTYFDQIRKQSFSCMDPQVGNKIALLDHSPVRTPALPCVELPLFDSRTGMPHRKAGLNWGQRPGREPNQTYVPIPKRVVETNPHFFPPRGCPFTLATDDGEFFSVVRAQDQGKAIESIPSNSILGRYFRKRMGIPLGNRVKQCHFDGYGRQTVTLTKLGEDQYHLDFSVA